MNAENRSNWIVALVIERTIKALLTRGGRHV